MYNQCVVKISQLIDIHLMVYCIRLFTSSTYTRCYKFYCVNKYFQLSYMWCRLSSSPSVPLTIKCTLCVKWRGNYLSFMCLNDFPMSASAAQYFNLPLYLNIKPWIIHPPFVGPIWNINTLFQFTHWYKNTHNKNSIIFLHPLILWRIQYSLPIDWCSSCLFHGITFISILCLVVDTILVCLIVFALSK